MGREYSVELDLIMGVIRVESNFREKITSHAGARGLMQVMPSTGRYFKCGVLFDAQDNVRCGVRILAKLLKRYDGNEVYALGAYNGGSGYIRKALRKKMVPPNLGYAEKVLRGRSRYRREGCSGLIRRL
jgi:soluble lytic murein transglycosylase-like protein